MKDLKDRQKKIFEFIREHTEDKGYPPTVREIGKALNIKSTSTVYNDMNALVDAGYLIKDPSKPRALVIAEPYRNPSSDQQSRASTSQIEVVEAQTVGLPLIGNIAAGLGATASEEIIEDYLPMPERFFGHGDHFVLKVRGDSMINIGIMDNDYIIVRKDEDVRNGDTVVAIIEDYEPEATVKTYYNEAGRIRLQPENDDFEPMYPNKVRIIGKVEGVFRYCSN